jgi:hypothetical protein
VARGGGGGGKCRGEVLGGGRIGRGAPVERKCQLGLGLGSATASHSWPVGRPEERRGLDPGGEGLGHMARVAGATPDQDQSACRMWLPDVVAGARNGRFWGLGAVTCPPGVVTPLGARWR